MIQRTSNIRLIALAGLMLLTAACGIREAHNRAHGAYISAQMHLTPFQAAVESDLNRQVAAKIVYQDGYFAGGDPPPNIGVCTDVVIRSYKAAGVDLQRLVARDIARDPAAYGIARPDPNIDHRRCRNLAIFFQRHTTELPREGSDADWQPGDIVFWDTSGNNGVPDHVGVIGDHIDSEGVPTVVHHWPGQFVEEQDWLYRLPVVYHFRWPERR